MAISIIPSIHHPCMHIIIMILRVFSVAACWVTGIPWIGLVLLLRGACHVVASWPRADCAASCQFRFEEIPPLPPRHLASPRQGQLDVDHLKICKRRNCSLGDKLKRVLLARWWVGDSMHVLGWWPSLCRATEDFVWTGPDYVVWG